MKKVIIPDTHTDCAPFIRALPPEILKGLEFTTRGVRLTLEQGDMMGLWREDGKFAACREFANGDTAKVLNDLEPGHVHRFRIFAQ